LGPYVSFRQQTPAVEVVRRVASGGWQDVFPVLSEDQTVVGIITSEILRTIAQEPGIAELTIADDMMLPPVVVQDDNDVSSALEVLLRHNAREVVVVDENGRIVGFLDEAEITHSSLSCVYSRFRCVSPKCPDWTSARPWSLLRGNGRRAPGARSGAERSESPSR
jgi:CBS-domain-containing membrane protein